MLCLAISEASLELRKAETDRSIIRPLQNEFGCLRSAEEWLSSHGRQRY